MRRNIFQYLLPPAFLTLHALLLLPILIQYKTDPITAESSLHYALNACQFAVPLGCLAFVSIAVFRLIIGSSPLPSGADRRLLAGRIEWILLFAIGIVEEGIRWGLVRYLVKLEGGGDSYGGKSCPALGNDFQFYDDDWQTLSVEVKPGIWEGVYVMCWVWSFLESVSAWWYLKPNLTKDVKIIDVEAPAVSIRSQSYQTWRKGHFKKRTTDSTIRTIRALSRKGDDVYTAPQVPLVSDRLYTVPDETTPLDFGAAKRYDDRSSSPELSRRSIREEDDDAGDEETSATDNDNEPLDSPMTPTNVRSSSYNVVPTRLYRNNVDEDGDEQEESTPTQQKHSSRFFSVGSATSESDYFGRPESHWGSSSNKITSPKRQGSDYSHRKLSVRASDSENESVRSGVQTPLLSSTIPFDQEPSPLSERPPLYTYGSTRSFHSVLDNLPLPPDMQSTRPSSFSRPELPSRPSCVSVNTGDEAEDEDDVNTNVNSTTRAYPSFPTYSASYNHTHFPSSIHSNATFVGTTLPFGRPSRPGRLGTSHTLPIRKGKTKRGRNPSFLDRNSSSLTNEATSSIIKRHVNGVEVNSVTFLLAICWRVVSALQHTGYGLWFAWLPSPIAYNTVEWWSILFFLGVAFSKSVYIAQSNTGWISSNGLLWPTTLGWIVCAFVLYFVVLILWGVLW